MFYGTTSDGKFRDKVFYFPKFSTGIDLTNAKDLCSTYTTNSNMQEYSDIEIYDSPIEDPATFNLIDYASRSIIVRFRRPLISTMELSIPL